jgi:hypothetical protein
MSGVRKLWAWIAEERNRTVLAFLGAGLAAVIAALWQAYVYFAPSPAHTRSQPQVQAAASSPTSADIAGAQDVQNSQARALEAEAAAIDNVTQQIQASGSPSPPPPAARH